MPVGDAKELAKYFLMAKDAKLLLNPSVNNS